MLHGKASECVGSGTLSICLCCKPNARALCVGHVEDPTSAVIPTGTKEPTNQREPLQGFVP